MKKTGSSYLIDTNIIIDFFSNEIELLDNLSKVHLLIPSIVIGELYYGAYLSTNPKLRINQIKGFVKECEIALVDGTTSKFYGEIKAQLKNDGTPIPENDVWIAALAMQYKVTLITRDKHFEKPNGINVENW